MTDNESYQVTIVLRGNPNITLPIWFSGRDIARKEMDAMAFAAERSAFYALKDDDGLPIEMIRMADVMRISCEKGSPSSYLAAERLSNIAKVYAR